jgi:hemerythrin
MLKTEMPVCEMFGTAHASLLDSVKGLERALRTPSGEKLAALRGGLEAMRDQIAEHFKFEEEYGYLEAVRKRNPQLEMPIKTLAEEHRCLTRELNALLSEANAAATLSEDLKSGVARWIADLKRHEHHENQLIQDAFNIDLGTTD